MTRRRAILGLAAALLATVAPIAGAQPAAFPERPVRLVMPFAPGGPTDTVARMIAQHLGKRLGQPVLVENRAGANGIIGTKAVARAPADGHTLLVAPTSHMINPIQDPGVGEQFRSLALGGGGGPPEVLDREVATRIEKYRAILRAARIEPE